MHEEEEQLHETQRGTPPQEQPPVPLTHSLGFGAGTFLAAGMVDLLAHLGPTGFVVGGIAAYVASRHGPQLYEQVREALPSPPAVSRQPGKARPPQRRTGGRSFMDRALGRFPEDDSLVEESEPTDQQSALNLVKLIGTDTAKGA